MFSSGCLECDRLFGDYRIATIKRLRLEGQRQIAAFAFERNKERIISEEVDLATAHCKELRADLARHRSIAHPSSEAARSPEAKGYVEEAGK
jgi:hypothetical protein